jgi:hypothetical protein
MTTFTFTAPNGEVFEIDAPNGTSQTAAKQLFDQQYNSGSLKNLGIGQALTGLGEGAKQATKSLAALSNVAVSGAVSAASVLKMMPATKGIGALDATQVTGLLGQAANAVGQAASAVSLEKGIGQFGLTPQQLEDQGFLKKGTFSQFIGNSPGADWTKVLANPGVWTGKDNVSGLTGFLQNPSLQGLTQQNIMSQGLQQLQTAGITAGITNPQQLGALVQGAAKFGSEAMAKWSKGSAPPDLQAEISDLAKNAQYAVNLVDTKLPTISGIDPAGIVDSVQRSGVDDAVKSFLGNDKIPPLTFGPLKPPALTRETEDSFYANTEDADLIYTGDDPIVWDRINLQRARRGLRGLAEIGYPRPPDDAASNGGTIST